MRVAHVVMVVAMAATAFADTLPPGVPAEHAALLDRTVSSMVRLAEAMYAVRGKCDELAAAMKRTMASDNKLVAELGSTLEGGPNPKAMQEYAAKKYKDVMIGVRDKAGNATLGCRAHKAVAEAWSQNQMLGASLGAMPPEPEKPVARPADYAAKTKRFAAAALEFNAAAGKIKAAKNCPAAAKFLKAFRIARDHLFAESDALDEATSKIVHDDKALSTDTASLDYVEVWGRCKKDKAFARSYKASGLAK